MIRAGEGFFYLEHQYDIRTKLQLAMVRNRKSYFFQHLQGSSATPGGLHLGKYQVVEVARSENNFQMPPKRGLEEIA